jgi:gluconate 2-dehydrogenase gamma chain
MQSGAPQSQPGMPAAPAHDGAGLMFFNESEFQTVAAIAARIVPSEPDGLGAREAGVAVYIDRAVAGYFRDLQGLYRQAVQALNDHCRQDHGAMFADLAPDRQDAVLADLDVQRKARSAAGDLAGTEGFPELDVEETLLSRFFAIIRDHTIQGMFCDPMYGGNRDFVGWRLIGFPGAQWAYSAEQMQPGFDATDIPIQSLSDLQRIWCSDHD